MRKSVSQLPEESAEQVCVVNPDESSVSFRQDYYIADESFCLIHEFGCALGWEARRILLFKIRSGKSKKKKKKQKKEKGTEKEKRKINKKKNGLLSFIPFLLKSKRKFSRVGRAHASACPRHRTS